MCYYDITYLADSLNSWVGPPFTLKSLIFHCYEHSKKLFSSVCSIHYGHPLVSATDLTRFAPYYSKVFWTIDIRVMNEEISLYKQGCLSFLFLLWCQINAGNFCRFYECKCMLHNPNELCSGLDLLSIKCGPFGPNQCFIIITLVNSTGTASTRERAQTITNDLLQFVTVQIQRHLMGITITMNL